VGDDVRFVVQRSEGVRMASKGSTRRAALRLDRDAILHLGDARCRPAGPFGDVSLVPSVNAAFEDHPAAVGLHRDPQGFLLGAALQRPLDRLFDLDGVDR
jgi:hypothetical protein